MRLLSLRPDGTFPPSAIPSSSSIPGTFYPEDYGAVGDGVTDDTEAWKACIAAAVAAAPEHNYAVTVQARPAEYLIAGDPVPGHEYGNAQIPIPHNIGTNRKIVLTIRGSADAGSLLYWNQDAPQSTGSVLKSTLADGIDDAEFGTPSVIGGPTNLADAPQDTYATLSNMLVVFDGIQIQVPFAASALIGIDLRLVANASLVTASVFADRSLNTAPPISAPATTATAGVYMPRTGNNVRNTIGAYTAEGLGIGIALGEHTQAAFIGLVYCHRGVVIQGNGGPQWPDGTQRYTTHGFQIDHLLVEATYVWLYNNGANAQVIIDLMGGEGVTAFTEHVYDPDDRLVGRINLLDIYQQFLTINGAAGMRIINDQIAPGPRADQPDLTPGVEVANPYYRDALVGITGAVTDVTIGGVSMGATPGQYLVPSGSTIEVASAGSPSWEWLLV